MTPRLLVAAPGSSTGKTTVTLLLAALAREQGLDVQGFKAGPDFIDPQYLTAVTGSAAPSLDPWFTGPAAQRRHFALWSQGADLVLVEGVMGLFDGKRDAPFGRYSSAELARSLDLPILLVLNAKKAGPTLATQALGLMQADPRLRYVGVVLNQAMGQKTADLLAPALKKLTGLPVLGWLPPIKELALPERHLGLTAPSELKAWEARLQAVLPKAAETLNFAAILRAAKHASAKPPSGVAAERTGARNNIRSARRKAAPAPRFKLAVALDEAFHFYYPENLALLEAHGADLAFFSPLRDKALPKGSQGLLLGGGFPESFGKRLAANTGLKRQVKAELAAGLPVWAECGGLMWLAAALVDAAGNSYPMVGALRARVRMTGKLQHFGYTEAQASAGHPFLKTGAKLKGHEFHHSSLDPLGPLRSTCKLLQSGRPARPEGWRLPGGIATYFHAYLPSHPDAARAFAARCLAWSPI
jgi:cobyrinic acid a,c-diamide synthase